MATASLVTSRNGVILRKTLSENISICPPLSEGQDVIHPLDRPIKSTGHIQILYGNLAPDGSMLSALSENPQSFKVGGPIALVEDGHDNEKRLIDLGVAEDELAARKKAWTAPPLKATRGTLYKYIKNVKSASEGTDEQKFSVRPSFYREVLVFPVFGGRPAAGGAGEPSIAPAGPWRVGNMRNTWDRICRSYVTEVCTICAGFPSEMVTLSGCDHRFVERHAAVKVTQGEVNIRCPAVNCAVSFSDEECGRLLSEKTLEMLAKRVKDLSIPDGLGIRVGRGLYDVLQSWHVHMSCHTFQLCVVAENAGKEAPMRVLLHVQKEMDS
ncbi:hypothetical protein SELMODRAFT_404530 [Selaginella moellendorffii]|uniref:Dihydroxy-acid/6-phosphogluconate dehydratase C-terminal domain-containing protein n=1 Tax=Selaginella moellendorffii TaxID=88036 RepID=D8QVM6_SELML|nr:hypothetical protein SELMODRAFT_404530 [Selaginella moellendorffii]